VTTKITDATLPSAMPLPVQAGRVALRRRFQKGTLITRGKTPTRCGIFREDVLQSDGTFKRVQRCVVLGPVSSLSKRAAWRRFQPHLDRVNQAAKLPPKSGKTLEKFIQEWRSSVAVNLKRSSARAINAGVQKAKMIFSDNWRGRCTCFILQAKRVRFAKLPHWTALIAH
jgi:hypothetical protein